MARGDNSERQTSEIANREHDEDGLFKYVRDETAITSIDAVTAAINALIVQQDLTTDAVDLATIQVDKTNALEIARGNVSGMTSVNKFGENTDIDADVRADIWDGGKTVGALPAGTSLIWLAPTAAAKHNIVSTSGSDDGNPVDVGARTLRIYGLPDWDTAEVNEDVTMNGTTDVLTSNLYVIIHRMEVLTSGGTSINVGTITATATAPSATTVTARIEAGQGQTHMAIYGVPPIPKALMNLFYASFQKSGGQTAVADIFLKVNTNPNVQTVNFVQKHSDGLLSVGSSRFTHPFDPPKLFSGPAIIKLQCLSGTANIDISAGFDLTIVDN